MVYRLGRAYDWQQLSVVIAGRTVVGISKLTYGVKAETALNYGAGGDAVSKSKGKREYEGAITLDVKEVLGILKAARLANPKVRDLTDVPSFSIICIWGDDVENKTFTDVLYGVTFTEHKMESSVDSTTVEMEIPLSIMGIEFGTP